MSFSDFKITAKNEPFYGKLKIDNIEISLNTWYSSTKQIEFEKEDPDHFGEPYVSFTLKTKNSNEKSNESTVTVNCPPDKSIVPLSENRSITITNVNPLNLRPHLPINLAVDRIKIVNGSYTGLGSIQLVLNDSSSAIQSQEIILSEKNIMRFLLQQLFYHPVKQERNFIKEIFYQVGNIDGYSPEIYNLSILVKNPITLNFKHYTGGTFPINLDYGSKTGTISILNKEISDIVKIQFTPVVKADFFQDPRNKFVIRKNGVFLTEIIVNQSFEYNIETEEFSVESVIYKNSNFGSTSVRAAMNCKIISINGNTNFVALVEEIYLELSITQGIFLEEVK